MNIIELFIVICVLTCGYFSGKYLGREFGTYGWIGGFFAGTAIAIIGHCLLRKLIKLSDKRHPPFPECKGCHLNNAYKPTAFTDQGIVFKCTCGKKYLKKNNQFMELLDDGSKHPYMFKYPCDKTWVPEENKSENEKI